MRGRSRPARPLIATRKGKEAIAALPWPRLKTEAALKVTWFADGAGVQIETAAVTDYVFVSDAQAKGTSADRKVSFVTQAGAVQVRKKSTTLTLGSAGTIQHGEKRLESTKATTRTDEN